MSGVGQRRGEGQDVDHVRLPDSATCRSGTPTAGTARPDTSSTWHRTGASTTGDAPPSMLPGARTAMGDRGRAGSASPEPTVDRPGHGRPVGAAPTASPADGATGQTGQELLGEPTDRLECVRRPLPRLDEHPVDPGLGVALDVGRDRIGAAEGDLGAPGPPGPLAQLGEPRHLGRDLAPPCGSSGSSRRRPSPPVGARPDRRHRCGAGGRGAGPAWARTSPGRSRRTGRGARRPPRTTGAGRCRWPRRPAHPGSRSRGPTASHSARSQLAPMPKSSRPPDTTSSVATARAVENGWRRPMLYTWVPNRIRSVRARQECAGRRTGRRPGCRTGWAGGPGRRAGCRPCRPAAPGARGSRPSRSRAGRPPRSPPPRPRD